MKKRIYWIDFAKFIAIIAVMIDHTKGILYTNSKIVYFSYYSVSLFILLMGVTSYWSYCNYKGSVIKKVGNGCWKIIRPYLVATFIYSIFIDHQFHFATYLNRIIYFNASEPFYYVLLYIQLLVLVPVLYSVLKYADKFNHGIIVEVVGLVIVLVISSWTTNYSNVLNVYGGGGLLFGGTYLILLYLGMLFGKHYEKKSINKIVLVIALFLSIAMTVLWWNFISVNQCKIDAYIPFGGGVNPPSISLGLYAIFMASVIYLLEMVLCFRTQLIKIFEIISVLGKHTLYIFFVSSLVFRFFDSTFL